MKALIVTWENFQDQEVIYPYYRLKEETEEVSIVANVVGKFFGIMGANMTSHILLNDLVANEKDYLATYDLLVLPGGVKALEKLRQEQKVIDFIRNWHDMGHTIASTCHGAQLLISAGVTKGRKISGYYSIADDIKNSGATYVNEAVVEDGNIVSSPHYDHMGIWMKTAIEQVQRHG